MTIAGLQKTSLLDYPGHVAAVVFLAGCNMNCGYCHNRSLISGSAEGFRPEDAEDFLALRKGLLDGVCITGGEPTIHADLPGFIGRIKAMGFAVKLDTNGANPEMLEDLLCENLLDYIAMDVKAPREKYDLVAGIAVSWEKIEQSIELIKASGVDYEFRTTLVKELDERDVFAICSRLAGAKRFALQQHQKRGANGLIEAVSYGRQYMQGLQERISRFFTECLLRGASV
ncbi:MAG: anaerobic ribonucleoside-triphosphate reductase activating protein [Bacillota bacterium]